VSIQVLIVDDDPDFGALVQAGLSAREFAATLVENSTSALDAVEHGAFDVVVTDVNLGSESGIDLCAQLTARRPHLPVVIMTAFGALEVAVDAIRAGAYDFITKPFKSTQLSMILRRATQLRHLKNEVKRLHEASEQPARFGELVGECKPMRRVYDLIERVAAAEGAVLVTGESGTGKELVARAIHRRSQRSGGPFVAINCAAMPAALLESELFGHVKGAFTDAVKDREGLFLQAHRGTLFLDEIGEMPLEMQAKLLRVLQENKVRPVGGNKEIPFDTRILSATNRDLEEEIEENRFREDLFYRIHVVKIDVPPLRMRGNDILALAQQFLAKAAVRAKKEVSSISAPAAQKLIGYDWPGNVRELEHVLERAVTLTRFDEIGVDDLPEKVREHQSGRMIVGGDDPDAMPTMEEMEKRYIRKVLEAVRGNKSHASRVLGMDRRTLYRKMERLDIGEPTDDAP